MESSNSIIGQEIAQIVVGVVHAELLAQSIHESTFKSQRAFNLQVLVTKQVIDWVYEVHSTRSIGIICILEFQIESILRCTSVLRHFFKGTH